MHEYICCLTYPPVAHNLHKKILLFDQLKQAEEATIKPFRFLPHKESNK